MELPKGHYSTMTQAEMINILTKLQDLENRIKRSHSVISTDEINEIRAILKNIPTRSE